MVVVLIPKDKNGIYHDIGLLDPIWKVMEMLIYNRLKKTELQDCLCGFIVDRSTGTAIMEVKLAQQLAYLEQVPLYGLCIDIQKAINEIMCLGLPI